VVTRSSSFIEFSKVIRSDLNSRCSDSLGLGGVLGGGQVLVGGVVDCFEGVDGLDCCCVEICIDGFAWFETCGRASFCEMG
jgi:hypothetical protein